MDSRGGIDAKNEWTGPCAFCGKCGRPPDDSGYGWTSATFRVVTVRYYWVISEAERKFEQDLVFCSERHREMFAESRRGLLARVG